ncbi:MAG: HDIG domain-containing protein [archaeon]|nr:HDIG domain-containing protein [archaeon]
MKIPTIAKCEALLEKYAVPEHIRLHSNAVRKVAQKLANAIKKRGAKVDVDAVSRAALMHDFMKMHCITHNCAHAQEAAAVFEGLGFSEFAKIIRVHGLEDVLKFTKSTPIEAKIVWYADKRVNHHSPVLLEERYSYLEERYGSKSGSKMGEIRSTKAKAKKIESELMGLSGFAPKDLLGA